MPTIIYEYGCRLDKECLPETYRQFHLAHNLYNSIIAIIREARDKADRYIKENEPAVADMMAKIDRVNESFSQAKAVNDEERMTAVAADRREAYKASRPVMKEARRKHKDALAQFFSVIGMKKECLTYQKRCEFVVEMGLSSSTADDIHATALKAWDKVRKDGGQLSFRSVKERQQDHINVRFTCGGGIDTKDLLSRDHHFISLTPPAEIGDRRYGEFKFRLGSAKANTNATGTWQYHRPFPEGSRVTTIRLIRRKIGPDTRWALQFQLSVKEYEKIKVKADRKPLVALHLGFNLSDEGYRRIGALADHADPGFAKFLHLPESIPMDLYRSERIQQERDENRDAIHAAIKSLTPAANLEEEIAEEWNAIKRLPAQHVSASRIVALSRKVESLDWEIEGILKKQAAQTLKEYAIKDYWLYSQQRHIQVRSLNRRKNFYRQVALDLVREYKTIVVSRFDLKEMSKRIKDTGDRNELGQIARQARQKAALYQLIECIQWACERSGSVLIEHTDMSYTKACASCETEYERTSDWLQCECGLECDIKANSAANLFSLREPTIDTDAAVILAEKAAKQQAALDKKQTKLEKMQAKRKALNAEELPEPVEEPKDWAIAA